MNWLGRLIAAGLLVAPLPTVAQTTPKPRKPVHSAVGPTSPSLSKAVKGAKTSRAAAAAGNKGVVLKQVSTSTAASVRGRRGSSHARVKKPPAPSYQLHPDPERYHEIQQSLADRGFFKGTVDGNWNDDSVQALHDFQAANQLDADGKISALTLMKLGLGPKHDGSRAPLSGTDALRSGAASTTAEPSATSDVPLPPPPTTLPPETETTPE